jgi:hypothetical protein
MVPWRFNFCWLDRFSARSVYLAGGEEAGSFDEAEGAQDEAEEPGGDPEEGFPKMMAT